MRNLTFLVARSYATLWIRAKARVVVKGLDELPARRKGERRVYLLLDRATSFDAMALAHVSKEPFAIMMDEESFRLPSLRRLSKGSGLIPLDPQNPGPALEAGAAVLRKGVPLLASLRDGPAGNGARQEPRTEAIALAKEEGASLYPIFLKAEDDRIRRASFKGADGVERPYTTFEDCFYFIEFLRPVDLSLLSDRPGEAELASAASALDALSAEYEARYEAFLADNRERFAPLRRRGGARYRVAW